MDAYMVSIGDYLKGYRTMAIFTNEKEAEKYADYLEKSNNGTEAFITSAEFNPEIPKPKTIGWDVYFDTNGTITRAHQTYDRVEYIYPIGFAGAMHIVVNKPDKDAAIASAIEARKKNLSHTFGL